nr:hypothetical protein B0A51_08978 [Rachicladosporium sp. CCFEE 5018]
MDRLFRRVLNLGRRRHGQHSTSNSAAAPSREPSPPVHGMDTFINPGDPQEVKDMKAVGVMALAWSRLIQAGHEGVADFVEALAIDNFGREMWLEARRACIEHAT